MATFIKTKFKISNDQTNIDKYRLAANITEYHIISKLILQRIIITNFCCSVSHLTYGWSDGLILNVETLRFCEFCHSCYIHFYMKYLPFLYEFWNNDSKEDYFWYDRIFCNICSYSIFVYIYMIIWFLELRFHECYHSCFFRWERRSMKQKNKQFNCLYSLIPKHVNYVQLLDLVG